MTSDVRRKLTDFLYWRAEALAAKVLDKGVDATTLIGLVTRGDALGAHEELVPRATFLPLILPMLRRQGEHGARLGRVLEEPRPHSLDVLCLVGAMGRDLGALFSFPLVLFNPKEVAPHPSGNGYLFTLPGWLKLLLATDPADLGDRRGALLQLHARVQAKRAAVTATTAGTDPGIDGALAALFNFDHLARVAEHGGYEALLGEVLGDEKSEFN